MKVLLVFLTGCTVPVDPCTLEDQANELAADEQVQAEIGLRTLLLSDDPLTLYNLTAALWDAGYDVEEWFREVLARCAPADETNIYALDMLAEAVDERGDTEQAARIRAHAEHLEDLRALAPAQHTERPCRN